MGKKRRNSSSNSQAAKHGQGSSWLMSQVKPPEPFVFQEPATWAKWITRYKLFHGAVGLSTSPADQQINMLLFCMGQEADALLSSLGMTDGRRISFDSVVATFEEHFTKKSNRLFNRAIFLERVQRPGENVDSYIDDLHKLSKKCEWSCENCKSKGIENEIMLLKLITGASDKTLSKHLLIQGNLTITGVVAQIKQSEMLHETDHTGGAKVNTAAKNKKSLKHQKIVVDDSARAMVDTGINDKKSLQHQKIVVNDSAGAMANNKKSPQDKQIIVVSPNSKKFEMGDRNSAHYGINDSARVMTNPDTTNRKMFSQSQQLQETVSFSPMVQNQQSRTPNVLNIEWPTLGDTEESGWTQVYNGSKNKIVMLDDDDDYDYWDLDSDEECEFLEYLQEVDPEGHKNFLRYKYGLDPTSKKVLPSMKTVPQEYEKQKSFENYRFSVTGSHYSRKSLKKVCQQQMKHITY